MVGFMETHENPQHEEQRWRPFALIILASALAHLWCLGSVFYMDDRLLNLQNEAITHGRFWEVGANAWTYLWYFIEFRLFGISAPGFHLFNWLIHTGVACVLFGFGRELLGDRRRWQVALFGAILFVVHPLGSEIPNYTRTQDLAWVTLFSLLAAWFTLRFVRYEGWKNLLWAALAIVGATFSKGPGLAHAVMMAGVVGIGFMGPEFRQSIFKHRRVMLGTLVASFAGVWFASTHWYHFNPLDMVQEPRFIGHAYTLGRVFWEFAWRSVLPISLCSDHHIAETMVRPGDHFWNIADHGAIVAMLTFLALIGFSILLTIRNSTRVVGVCLFLYCGSILFRMLYVIPEFMPEYRIYPGLPWFCLGVAVVLHGIFRKFTETSLRVPAVLLVFCFIVLSARRSFVWHSLDRLMDNVLAQYPTQARALWELDDRDVAESHWQEIITRQRTVWPEVFRKFLATNQKLLPARELPTGHFALADVACRGSYALAIAHTENPAAGLREIAKLEVYMRQLGIDEETHALHWGYLAYYKALILELAGKHQAALDSLDRESIPGIAKDALKKLQAE